MDMDATLRGGEYHVVSNLQTFGRDQRLLAIGIQRPPPANWGVKNFAPSLYDSFYVGRAGKKQPSIAEL